MLIRSCPNPTDAPRTTVGPFLALEGPTDTLRGAEPLPTPAGETLVRVLGDGDLTSLALDPALPAALGLDDAGYVLPGDGGLLACALDDASLLLAHQVAWQQYRTHDGLTPCVLRLVDGLLTPVVPTPGHLAAAAAARATSNWAADQWNAQQADIAPALMVHGVWASRCFASPDGAETVVERRALAEGRLLLPEVPLVRLVDGDSDELLSWAGFRARAGDALTRFEATTPARWLLSRWV